MQADPHKALDALVAAFGGFWTSDRLVIRRIRGLASIDPDFESAVHARDERRQVGIRTILGRLANKRQKRSAAELDEVIAIVQMLTSFETFDNLAGLDRDLDEVVSLVCRLVWAAVARQKAIARLSLQRLRSRFFIAMVRSEDPANGPNA